MKKRPSNPPFLRRRSRQAALAAMIAALLPGAAAAEAGRVTFAHGDVAATGADGARRGLARGADVEPGDTINTGKRAHAQLRFTDGSFVSLKPDSEFRIDEYQFKEDSDDDRGFFSLLRGGLRTITGLVGRTRKAAYRMRTPVATIGIRGTEYNLELIGVGGDNPILEWNVADDGTSSISILLPNGQERVISWGGSGSASREDFQLVVKALQQLADEGRLEGITRDEIAEIFASGDVVDDQGRALELLLAELLVETAAPPPDCSAAPKSCTVTSAFGTFDGEVADAGVAIDGGEGSVVGATFDADGALVSYASDGSTGFPISGLQLGLGSGQAGTAKKVVDGSAYFSVDPANPQDLNAVATWGRWVGPGTTGGDSPHPLFLNSEDDTFAFAVSIPPAVLYNMGTAQYTVAGFTPPSAVGFGAAALGAAGDVTGTLSADFDMQEVDFDIDVTFANGAYNLQPDDGPFFLDSGPGFTGDGQPFFKGTLGVSGSGVACDEGCTGVAGGNFFGPRADGATLGYKVQDSNLGAYVTGVTVFQQQSCQDCGVAANR